MNIRMAFVRDRNTNARWTVSELVSILSSWKFLCFSELIINAVSEAVTLVIGLQLCTQAKKKGVSVEDQPLVSFAYYASRHVGHLQMSSTPVSLGPISGFPK